jgi:hypothetical protein
MTTMPDLIAKTRIFATLETMLNAQTTETLMDWQTKIASNDLLDLIDELRASNIYDLSDEDYEHFKLHVFGRPNNENKQEDWWGTHVEDIMGEGLCHLLEHMIYKTPYMHSDGQQTPHRMVESWWLCPATYYFRTIVTTNKDNDAWVTFHVITPPKGDHKKHYKEYKKRLPNKQQETHINTPDDYDKLERIWVTSHGPDSVKWGKDNSNATVPLSVVMTPFKIGVDVETVQLYCEQF